MNSTNDERFQEKDARDVSATGAATLDAPRQTAPRRYSRLSNRNRCRFCSDQAPSIDYKNVSLLEGLCTPQGRMASRKRSGTCAAHQRLLKRAIKQARYIGLLSPVRQTRPRRTAI